METTNEEKTIEKTQEIVSKRLKWIVDFIERNLNISKDDMNLIRLEMYDAILEMAEWKDDYFKKNLFTIFSFKSIENIKKYANEIYKEITGKDIKLPEIMTAQEMSKPYGDESGENEQLAKTISETSYEYGDYLLGISNDDKEQRYIGAIQMAELKDKNNKERELLLLLLEAINYSFLQTDGNYDNKLTYPVIDKVKYIYSQLHLIDNNSDINNKIGHLKK